MEKRNKNKKSGFTLIELVVVIAIIGVLAAVITPRVRQSLAKAKDAKAIAALDALRTASNVYYAETGDTLVTAAGDFTKGHAKILEDKGYLDSRGATALGATASSSDAVAIPVGSVITANCGASNATYAATVSVGVEFETDKVGLKFKPAGAYYNTSCELWTSK